MHIQKLHVILVKISSQNNILLHIQHPYFILLVIKSVIKNPATGHLKESSLPVFNCCHANMTSSCISVNKLMFKGKGPGPFRLNKEYTDQFWN